MSEDRRTTDAAAATVTTTADDDEAPGANGSAAGGAATSGGAESPSGRADVTVGDAARRIAGRLHPGRVAAALRDRRDDSRSRREGALTAIVSFGAVLGYALCFGAAVGAVGTGVTAIGLDAGVEGRLLALGGLLVPPAAFLFVALHDDATLTRPEWSRGHPPPGDAWLVAMVGLGTAVLVLPPALLPGPLALAGWGAALLAAYAVAPFWLARRCLDRPSWALGGLTLLVAPLVVLVAVIAVGAWFSRASGLVALTAAVVGTTLPYGMAAATPGPDGQVAGLRRAAARLPGALRRALRRVPAAARSVGRALRSRFSR